MHLLFYSTTFYKFLGYYRIFEATTVLENEVVNNVADKYCHAGSDIIHSKKKISSTVEHLEKEPATPGEQVL